MQVIPDDEMPIPHCLGLSRDEWCKKEVSLHNEGGEVVATAYVEFAKEWQSIDARYPLGSDHVGVVVCEVYAHWHIACMSNAAKVACKEDILRRSQFV